MNIYTFTAHKEDIGKRVDIFLERNLSQQQIDISRSFIQNYFDHVQINNLNNKKNYRLREGDLIKFSYPEQEPSYLIPEALDIEYVYEDEYLMIVNKPAGMVVHPAKGHQKGTLVHGLLHKLQSFGGDITESGRPGIVHRLDKETSGLIIIAKDISTQRKLVGLFQNRQIEKKYTALVRGITSLEGKIDQNIGRHPVYRKKFKVSTSGKQALTYYKRTSRYRFDKDYSYSLLEINLITGRTHQIRVHLSSLGHPVLGDIIYSKPKNTLEKMGMALCANYIFFKHPVTGNQLKFSVELPQYFRDFFKHLHKMDD